MIKSLEAVKRVIKNTIALKDRNEFEGDMLIIAKDLQALEIIKAKSVNVRNLIIYCFEMNHTYKDYVESFNYDNYWELGKELLTEGEYNLLKEVLYYGKE